MLVRLISFEDREPFMLGALRRMLKDVQSEVHRSAVHETIRNRTLRRAVVAGAWDMFQAEVGGDGRLLEFFQWIIDNQDSIIELIMKLMPLFV